MKIIKYAKLLKKCNKLEVENEELQEIIKNELYIDFMEDLALREQVKILKEENDKYRKKIKELKNEIFKSEN